MTKKSSQSSPLLDFIEENEEVQGEYFQILDEGGAPISVSALFVEREEDKTCSQSEKKEGRDHD